MTKQTVVIPLDGSDYSLRILPTVAKFLSPDENRLILLRVCRDSIGMVALPLAPAALETTMPVYNSRQDVDRANHPIYATQIQESQRGEVMAELQETVRGLEALGYEVDVEVSYGDPAEEIINFVTLTPVDLVAMTTHGRTGLSKLLFGNVAEALIRHSAVPVLLLRPFTR